MNKTERKALAWQKVNEMLGDREPTAQNVLEASIVFIRQGIYKDYPNTERIVIEALLLMYKAQVEQVYEYIAEYPFKASDGKEEILRANESLFKALETLKVESNEQL